MKKVPNLFERDWQGNRSRVLAQFSSADVAWVGSGEGMPTVKWDGSATMVRDGLLYVRYDAKQGKAPPSSFEPCQEADPVTGHRPGWIPALGNPAAKWHLDGFANCGGASLPDGTYEALGPQHQSNPYSFSKNLLVRHGIHPLNDLPDIGLEDVTAHRVLRDFLSKFKLGMGSMPAPMGIEGIVWHHPDGRMVKVLSSDLGVAWREKQR